MPGYTTWINVYLDAVAHSKRSHSIRIVTVADETTLKRWLYEAMSERDALRFSREWARENAMRIVTSPPERKIPPWETWPRA